MLSLLTRSTGGSRDSRMVEEEEGGEAAVAGTAVHSLAAAACGGMAATK